MNGKQANNKQTKKSERDENEHELTIVGWNEVDVGNIEGKTTSTQTSG